MNRFVKWLMDGIRFLLAEFFAQIVAAVILFAAFVAWAYFSSIYAAIPVVIAGIVLWALAGKIFRSKKQEGTGRNR